MSTKSSVKALTPEIPLDLQYDAPVCGIDEVGRGPLAGPVVSVCAHIPADALSHPIWNEITDSKKISAVKRKKLFDQITNLAFYGIGICSPEEIDDLNIHHATLLAMTRAHARMVEDFRVQPQQALIDGKFIPKLPCSGQAIIGGDSLSVSIGVASIIAKVYRDRLMTDLHQDFPHYGWNTNAGYGTAQHLDGIKLHGITEHHRKSFAPCAQEALDL